MIDDLYCPICNELNLRWHKCNALYECTGYDPREEGSFDFEIKAISPQDAAEAYAIQQSNCGDWPSEDKVYVREKGKARVTTFVVSVQSEPVAYSKEDGNPFNVGECELCGMIDGLTEMVLHDDLGIHCRACQLKHNTMPDPSE